MFSSGAIGQGDGYSISSPGPGASLAFPSRRSRLGFFPTESQGQSWGDTGGLLNMTTTQRSILKLNKFLLLLHFLSAASQIPPHPSHVSPQPWRSSFSYLMKMNSPISYTFLPSAPPPLSSSNKPYPSLQHPSKDCPHSIYPTSRAFFPLAPSKATPNLPYRSCSFPTACAA